MAGIPKGESEAAEATFIDNLTTASKRLHEVLNRGSQKARNAISLNRGSRK